MKLDARDASGLVGTLLIAASAGTFTSSARFGIATLLLIWGVLYFIHSMAAPPPKREE